MSELYVEFNRLEDEIFVEEKYEGQTYHLGIQYDIDEYNSTLYGNVVLFVNTKRKHRNDEMDNAKSTGHSLLHTYAFARNALPLLEKRFERDLIGYGYNKGIISVYWADNRRRNVYEKFLKPYGYRFGSFFNHKRLLKVFEGNKEDICWGSLR